MHTAAGSPVYVLFIIRSSFVNGKLLSFQFACRANCLPRLHDVFVLDYKVGKVVDGSRVEERPENSFKEKSKLFCNLNVNDMGVTRFTRKDE